MGLRRLEVHMPTEQIQLRGTIHEQEQDNLRGDPHPPGVGWRHDHHPGMACVEAHGGDRNHRVRRQQIRRRNRREVEVDGIIMPVKEKVPVTYLPSAPRQICLRSNLGQSSRWNARECAHRRSSRDLGRNAQ